MSKLRRLFHSILNLRQVLQSSAHWLLLMDKKKYYNDQSKPFLLMVLIQTVSSLITDTQFAAIFKRMSLIIIFSSFTYVPSDLIFRTM